MLFSGLPPAGLAAIIDSMQPQMATAGKEIIKQVGIHHMLLVQLLACMYATRCRGCTVRLLAKQTFYIP